MKTGSAIVALATPFGDAGLDESAFADFVAWHLAQGTTGFVTGSVTGEGATLTAAEHERLVRICVEAAAGQAIVIAATGTNGTASTITRTRQAKAAGADAALVVTPAYSRPNQEGLFRHFDVVARAVDLPILVMNAPSRTGVDLLPPTLARLACVPGLIGIVDATGDPGRPAATRRVLGDGFPQLCGRDDLVLPFTLAGGQGWVSAAANVAPRLCAALRAACHAGRLDLAQALRTRLDPLFAALGPDGDPAPLKRAITLLRPDFSPQLRLPLTPIPQEAGFALAAALRSVLEATPDVAPVVPRNVA